MIKAGIIGGSNPMAGELIRLLINHPDVEIIWVDSARFTGRLVSDVHHGLLGETQLRISPSHANLLSDIDVLFIFRHQGQTLEWLEQNALPEGLKVVDLSVDMRLPKNSQAYGFVYGLPELNRKAMVRGATRAVVPHPAANITELSLLPLAKSGQLAENIQVKVQLPQQAEQVADAAAVAQEVLRALQELDPQANPEISIRQEEGPTSDSPADVRSMKAVTTFTSTLDIGEIILMFEEFYDDHTFTIIVNQEPQSKEVAGTNRCLLRIEKHDKLVTITAVMDALLKGAAGTAVHDMNLLFGLHEKVALALKASTY